MSTRRVAFVCTGNICRSPMAAVLAPPLFEERGMPVVVISGGTLNLQGKRAARHAISAVKELGLSLSGHRSQGAHPALMRMAEHIIIMAPHHGTELIALDPSLASKLVPLWEYYPLEDGEQPLTQIDDPVGKSLETFKQSRDIIQACLRAWIATL